MPSSKNRKNSVNHVKYRLPTISSNNVRRGKHYLRHISNKNSRRKLASRLMPYGGKKTRKQRKSRGKKRH